MRIKFRQIIDSLTLLVTFLFKSYPEINANKRKQHCNNLWRWNSCDNNRRTVTVYELFLFKSV